MLLTVTSEPLDGFWNFKKVKWWEFNFLFNPYLPVQNGRADLDWSSIHIRPYILFIQFISTRTKICTGGNELNFNPNPPVQKYVRAEMNWMNKCTGGYGLKTGHNGLLKTLHFPINLPVKPVQIHINIVLIEGFSKLIVLSH